MPSNLTQSLATISDNFYTKADAVFSAHARTALPACLRVIETLGEATTGVIAYADDPRIVAQLEDALAAAEVITKEAVQ